MAKDAGMLLISPLARRQLRKVPDMAAGTHDVTIYGPDPIDVRNASVMLENGNAISSASPRSREFRLRTSAAISRC